MDPRFAPTAVTDPPQDFCTPSTRIIVGVTAQSAQVTVNTRVQLEGTAEKEVLNRTCDIVDTPLPFTWNLSFQAPGSSSLDITSRLDGRTTLTPSFIASEAGVYQAQISVGLRAAAATITAVAIEGAEILGFEWNQGLPGYGLVAGKDTLVRVFIAAPAAQQPATFDYADLRIQGPAGIDFTTDADLSSGVFSNTVKSYSETDNLNYYIRGDQIPAIGQYHGIASLYRNGQLVGSLDLGYVNLLPTKDIRLLIVIDNWPLSVAGWHAVRNALSHISRNYPIRSGIGPMDGDRSLGLRYVINPSPIPESFDQGWPTPRQAFQEFNNRQQQLGNADRADKVLIVRDLQPGEPPLGGAADFPGIVAGAVYTPGSNYFTTIVCQELGHTVGIDHSPNPFIPDPSAFDLLNRRAIATAVPFMHNPVGPDDAALFEVGDWNTVRARLLELSSTGPQ